MCSPEFICFIDNGDTSPYAGMFLERDDIFPDEPTRDELAAIYTGSTTHLVRWLEISPHNAITVLDTHDGIGVVDVGSSGDRKELLPTDEVDRLVNGIHSATRDESRLATGRQRRTSTCTR